MMKRDRSRRWSAAALALAVLASCADSTGPSTLVGRYALQTFGGDPLPATVEFGSGGSLTVYAGELILTRDEDFTLLVDALHCSGEGECSERAPVEETGYFQAGDGVLVLYMDLGGSVDGQYAGNQIVLHDTNPGSTWIRRAN